MTLKHFRSHCSVPNCLHVVTPLPPSGPRLLTEASEWLWRRADHAMATSLKWNLLAEQRLEIIWQLHIKVLKHVAIFVGDHLVRYVFHPIGSWSLASTMNAVAFKTLLLYVSIHIIQRSHVDQEKINLPLVLRIISQCFHLLGRR